MHADPDICTWQPGWYPGVNSLPDGFSHVPRICPPFELSQFCSRQAQISIYALHQARFLHRFFMGHCTHQLNFGDSPLIPGLGH